MPRGDSKADPRPIIWAHLASYVDQRTGRQRLGDHFVMEGLPCVAGAVSALVHLHLPDAASTGLLTVSGLLSAFLFALMIQVADRASSWADSHPVPSRETTDHAIYLGQLSANAGYSSIVSVAAAVAFAIAAACSQGWPLLAFSCVGVVLGVHLILTLLMVMKRVFVLTQRQLVASSTGVHETI